jgi:hypothetical protein
MKRYYILGGDTYVADEMPLTTLVVDDPSRKTGRYNLGEGKGGVIGRPVMTVDGNFKNGLKVEAISRKKLIQMAKGANCVFGATKLLKGTGSEFKRALEQTKSAETFVIVGEVYSLKEDPAATYDITDRVGYEIVLVRNMGGSKTVQAAYKSVVAFAEWERSNKNQARTCANASVDRSGANATIRFKDSTHSGVAMIFGTFKSAKPEAKEEVKAAAAVAKATAKVEAPTESKTTSPYTPEQLEEIRLGKAKGVNTAVYENPAISAPRMKRIRHFLEKGYAVEPLAPYATATMSDEVFDLYCRLCQTGDISPYVYDKIDVGSVYTLFLEYAGDEPDTKWLDRAKKKAGKNGIITLDLLDSVAK